MANKSLDGVLVKKAHTKQQFTDDEIIEFAKCLDPKTGYLYFAKNFFYIQHAVQGKLLFSPFPYQERLLASYHNYTYNINLLPRQSGKCVQGDTKIKIKHKVTGEEHELSIGHLFNMQKNNKGK